MRIATPATAGRLLAASVAATPVPVTGPSMPSRVVSFAPTLPQHDAHEVTTQWSAGFAAVRTRIPQGQSVDGSPGQAWAVEAMASEIQGAFKTASAISRHLGCRELGLPVVAGILGGLVLREAGAHWGNQTLERMGRTITDVGDFAGALLAPNGRLIDGIAGGLVVTADLCGFALPASTREIDNSANLIKWADGLAAHGDDIMRSIALGAPYLSPSDPGVIPAP